MLTEDEYKAALQNEYLAVAKMGAAEATFKAEAAQMLVGKAEAEKRTAELCMQRFQNENRPSIILKATLSQEGDLYVASFGCMSITGETPEIAFQNFDEAWTGHE